MISSFKNNPALWLLLAVSLACLLLAWRCDHLAGRLTAEKTAHNATRAAMGRALEDKLAAELGLAASLLGGQSLGQRAQDCENQRKNEALQYVDRQVFFETITTQIRSRDNREEERVLDHESRTGFTSRFNAPW